MHLEVSSNTLVPHKFNTETRAIILLPPSNEKTLEWLAVLGAADIEYELAKDVDHRWQITIAEKNCKSALGQLRDFEEECKFGRQKFIRMNWTHGMSAFSVSILRSVFFASSW